MTQRSSVFEPHIAIGYLYGLLCCVGGLVGFFIADSKGSLFGGVGVGIAMFLATFSYSNGSILGFVGQILTAVLMCGFMGFRYVTSKKFMPAGMFCALSASVVTAMALLRVKRKKASGQNTDQ